LMHPPILLDTESLPSRMMLPPCTLGPMSAVLRRSTALMGNTHASARSPLLGTVVPALRFACVVQGCDASARDAGRSALRCVHRGGQDRFPFAGGVASSSNGAPGSSGAGWRG